MYLLSDFTEEEFQLAKEKIEIAQLSFFSGQEQPFAVLTGGQPGAGKTTIVWEMKRNFKGDIVFINGDDYRKAHPRFLDIYKNKGGDFAAATGKFSGRMVEEIVEAAAKRKINMVVEGTLRSTAVPNKTRAFLQEYGYKVILAVMVVRPEISYLSTLKRYKIMLDNGTSGRQTSKADHDLVVGQIISNLDTLYKENKFDNILLYDRDGRVVYNKNKTPDKNPAEILRKEFTRALSNKERIDMAKPFIGFVEDNKIKEVLFLSDHKRSKGVNFKSGWNCNNHANSLKPKPGNPADGNGGGPGGGRGDD